MILTEKQQKILGLSTGKVDKYESLTGEEILPSDQRRVIKQAKFTYSPSGKPNQNGWRSRRKTNNGTWKAQKIINYV